MIPCMVPVATTAKCSLNATIFTSFWSLCEMPYAYLTSRSASLVWASSNACKKSVLCAEINSWSFVKTWPTIWPLCISLRVMSFEVFGLSISPICYIVSDFITRVFPSEVPTYSLHCQLSKQKDVSSSPWLSKFKTFYSRPLLPEYTRI